MGYDGEDMNIYRYCSNDPADDCDPMGLKGSGHHMVPWSIFNGAVSEEVQKFFDSDVARIFNDYYKTHGAQSMEGISAKKYNALVSEELESFLGKKALKDMTLQEAKAFLARLNGLGGNSPIAIYNNAVRKEAQMAMRRALTTAAEAAAARSLARVEGAGATKMGGKLAKGVPVVGMVLAVYFVFGDAEVYGWEPAIKNGVVDAIPIVGTGKILGEAYAGHTLLEVYVGPKAVQPTTVCEKP